jgi:hypothetical protein
MDPTMYPEPRETYLCQCGQRHYQWQACPQQPATKEQFCGDCGDTTPHTITTRRGSRFERCLTCGSEFEIVGLNYARKVEPPPKTKEQMDAEYKAACERLENKARDIDW